MIFYHIYPIGLTGAPRNNTLVEEQTPPAAWTLNEWLPHIKSIGCDAIYIGPLFESDAHGYDTRDYRSVDRRLGCNEDFAGFVREAHALGIRVVVDGVFNHTGRNFFAFLDVRKNREQSPYCSWYKGLNFGCDNAWQDGFSYEAWRNCFDLVNLNLENEAVRQYLLHDVIEYWIDTFDIDGIRLDCADCLPDYFMEEMRRTVDAKRENFYLLGEVIHGDYNRYVREDRLDAVTNYELHKALYSGHNDHNYFEIAHTARREFEENGGLYRGKTLYSFVDNHDVDRIASKLNDFTHIYNVYTLLYTMPGSPSIYYGSEWGIEGRKEGASDEGMRQALDLAQMERDNPHPELIALITKLASIYKDHRALSCGIYRELYLTNRQYAFARICDGDMVIVAVNNDENESDLYFSVPFTEEVVYNEMTDEQVSVENGQLHVKLSAHGSAVMTGNNI